MSHEMHKKDVLWLLLLWALVFSVSDLCSVCAGHPGLRLETRERPAAHIQPDDEHESTPDGGVWRGRVATDGLSRTGEVKVISLCGKGLRGSSDWKIEATSWKSCDISHTKQELLCISHLCRSDKKKSRSKGVCVSAWTIQFIKHVLPRLIRPRRPESRDRFVHTHNFLKHWRYHFVSGELNRELTDLCFDPDVPEAMSAICF